MPSILRRSQQSKLQNLNTKPEEKIVSLSRRTNSSVKSFRFDEQSWQDLQAIVENLNNVSRRKISTNRLVKALIYLGRNSNERELLRALKEIAV